MLRFIIPIGLFAALAVFLFVGLSRDKETLPSPLIGKPAPQFELPRVEDPSQKISSREFAGKPYVVNIWGSWCFACRDEHPVLMELARRAEVPLVGLNWKDELAAAQEWLKQFGNPYVATAFDPQGDVGIDWGAYGAPETYLVDAQGIIVYKYVSPVTIEVWEREFLPRIKRGGAKGE
ncbi:MAG TPA: DsbE family thiol:disulfide interchange protein [Steroidobacteraceae bacterium]|nr:DsbE family thiol:disulfide interchange protein [Steroidobacteraceae bacterium]